LDPITYDIVLIFGFEEIFSVVAAVTAFMGIRYIIKSVPFA